MEFEKLVNSIQNTHEELQLSAIKAVNQSLTLRNWLIGLYIIEFEQKGKERAKYGEQLLPELAASIKIKGLSVTNLKLCRQFYIAYPHLISAVKDILINSNLKGIQIGQSATDQLQSADYKINSIHQSTTDELKQAFQHPIKNGPLTDPVEILSKISFTHLVQLLPIQNLEKRAFYEFECIRQAWSVGELKRQINTLYYERSEFLGLKAKDVVYENDLEKSLLEHLEGFLLEMGQGFCFEAKQKRILIGGEYFFIDLVFYHRILKCHVLVELKIDEAKHEHIGQLKTYVNYYKKEMMQKDDNPPVGLLLVTNQNKALVEYAIADSDQQLFVSKYLLELPSEEELIAEIEREKNILREQGIVYGREN